MKEPNMRLVYVQNSETRAERRKRRRRALFSLRAVREVVLTVGAILGVLCLVSGVAAIAFDIKPIVFQSGSMAPAVDTGALGISRTVPASDLKVGDVVTVRTGTGVRVTHRIKDISHSGDKATLVLKGDANKVPDDKVYVVKSAPRLLFDVPKAGYVVSFISGPIGIFAGGLMVGVVLLTVFRPGNPRSKSKGGGSRKAFSAAAVMIIGTSVTGVFSGAQTQAYYTDSATATSGTFSGAAAVVITNCTTSGNSLTITWTAPVSPTTWEFRYAYTTPAGGTEVDSFAGSLRTRTSSTNLNNKAGTVTLVGIFPSPTGEKTSFTYAFSGNGANRSCTLVP
ncbi:signal peptidase I [Aeromicrobium ginsengisoli]|uniref:Signal peptidase I n=1 Tax=Aeromicrobium ginsengisoli TaxID=363867 RepID=A0A5M4FGX2_9ACTN|nr:signal peptidase I [Aeromicrobium ginsengisoli]KAA1399238.1 signal peptidase I [Aeromicrobium ginsengisoli]